MLIIFIGNIYLSRFGLWSVVIGVALFLFGNMMINKKMEPWMVKKDLEKRKNN